MSYFAPTVRCTGVDAVESAYYTLTNGVIPGSVILRINPQLSPIPSDVQVTFNGEVDSIVLKRCVVNYASMKRNLSQQVYSLRAWDRRKLWENGSANGRFNVHRPDGSIQLRTKEHLRGLAVLLLDAAGESGYDVSLLPNDVFPEVEWDGDIPMFALEELVSPFGFVICWNPNTDVVSVIPHGYGQPPNFSADTSSLDLSVDQNLMPDSIALYCGRVLFQTKVKLKAVVPEIDNSVVALDDASYKPQNGWVYQQGTEWEDVAIEHGEYAASLAREAAYKWFRVDTFSDGTLNCDGYWDNPIHEIGDILPLNYHLADLYAPVGATYLRQKPTYVQGVFFTSGRDGIDPVGNTDPNERLDSHFGFDHVNGIYKFPEPIVKREGNQFVEPELWATVSFYLSDKFTLLKKRFILERDLGGSRGTGARIEKREEIQRQIIANFPDDDPTAVPTIADNEDDATDEANLQLDLVQASLQPRTSRVVMARGFHAQFTDGVTLQVVWSQDLENGADTVAGAHAEFDAGALRLKQQEQIRAWNTSRREGRSGTLRDRRARDELR